MARATSADKDSSDSALEVRASLDRPERHIRLETQHRANSRGLVLQLGALPRRNGRECIDRDIQLGAVPAALPQPADNAVDEHHREWRGRSALQHDWCGL